MVVPTAAQIIAAQGDSTNATVVIGEVPITSSDFAVNLDGVVGGVWNNYQVMGRYWTDPHRYMVGVTSPGGFQGASCAFVQLAANTELWVVDWTASRFNTVPYIPDPDLQDPNWVFLGHNIEPAELSLAPDNSPLYTISGTYVYGRKNPKDNFQDVVFYRPAWMDNSFSRTIPKGVLQKGIITAPGSAGSAGTASPGVPGDITRSQ